MHPAALGATANKVRKWASVMQATSVTRAHLVQLPITCPVLWDTTVLKVQSSLLCVLRAKSEIYQGVHLLKTVETVKKACTAFQVTQSPIRAREDTTALNLELLLSTNGSQ